MSSRYSGYLLAAATAVLALLLRLLLQPLLGSNGPYATFVIAVAITVYFRGAGPGLVAMFLGGGLAVYFVVPPVRTFAIHGTDNKSVFGLYLAVSVTLLLVVKILRGQKSRSDAQREQFEVTLASLGEGVISINLTGKITFMNPMAADLTGWSREAGLGMPVESVCAIQSQETGEPIENPARRAIRESRIAEPATGAMLMSKGGARRPISASSAPICDRSGSPVGAVLVFRDQTEARKRDAEIRELNTQSEDRFRLLADSIPHLAWMAHPDGHIFWYNRRWYEYTGRTLEDMQGWGWQSVHDPAMLPRVLKEWQASIQTGRPFDMTIPLLGSDGQFRTFMTRVMPAIDSSGNVIRWFGTNTDITERQQNEDQLRRQEERFRRLYEANIVGIACVDTERVFESNDVFLTMLGFDRDDLAAGRLQWGQLSGPEHLHTMGTVLEDVVANGYSKPVEKEFTTKDGGRVPVLFGATLLQREPLQWLGVVLDLTERKQLEARVLEAQKLDSVGLLAGGVAHDFNNLLVGVVGNASLAIDLVPPESEAAGLLDRIMKIGEQLAHLTRQLLAYAGKGRFFIEPIDISELAEDMSELVQPSIPKKIALQMEWAGQLPAIDADRGQVQQIFTNLVLNAAEAIGNANGEILLRTGIQHIDDTFLARRLQGAPVRTGAYVFLEVRDNGCGMDDTTKARLFDPFFSTKFTGRGLGMAAVAGIVRSHKGAIVVESSPGAGSCIMVLFPASKVTAPPSRPRTTRGPVRGSGTVLMVDDEPTVRELARRALEHYGYHVLLAASAREAVDIFKRHPGQISVVVLDQSMPVMGGEEVLPELRRIRPEVRVVVSSGYSEQETMALFKSQRIAGFLQKPYTPKALAARIAAALL